TEPRHVSRKFSGVGGSETPVLRTTRSSWMLLQPVYCTSAITSQRSLMVRKNDTLAVSGISTASVTSVLANNGLAFTLVAFAAAAGTAPLATAAPTPCAKAAA